AQERKAKGERAASDPDLAFGTEGEAYFVSMDHPKSLTGDVRIGDPDVGALIVSRSRDSGATWGAATRIERFVDRPFLAIDRTRGIRRGRLYFNSSVQDAVAVYDSGDGGRTFGPPREWSPDKPGYYCFGAGDLAVLSDG